MNAHSKRWGWYFGYYLAVLLIVGAAAGMLFSLTNGLKMVGRPFPGFFVLRTFNSVHFHTWVLPSWTGLETTKLYPRTIRSVDDRPVKDEEDIFYRISSEPLGSIFSYGYAINGQNREIKVKSMVFGWTDFIQTYGFLTLTGFCFLVGGALVYFIRPNTSMSWASLLLGVFVANTVTFQHFADPLESLPGILYSIFLAYYSLFYYFLGISISLGVLAVLDEPAFLKKNPFRYFYFYVPYFLIYLFSEYCSFFISQDLSEMIYILGRDAARITLAASSLYAVYSVVRLRYFSRRPIVRQRARLLLWGVGMTFLATAFGFISATMGNPMGFSFSYIALLAMLFPVSIAYGALGGNLFGVEDVVRRGVQYVSIFFIFGALIILLLWLTGNILSGLPIWGTHGFRLFGMIVFLLLTLALKQKFKDSLDRLFFRSKVDYNRVVEDVKSSLAVLPDKEKIVEVAEEILNSSLQIENAKLFIKDGRLNRFVSMDKSASIDFDNDLVTILKNQNDLLSSADIMIDEKYAGVRTRALAQLARIESAYVLPVVLRGEMLGLLGLGEKKSGDLSFSIEDIRVIKYVAYQAGQALKNVQLYDQMEVARQELNKINTILEYRVQERKNEMIERNRQLEEANQKLVLITRHKARFLANMSHDLRSPLNGILGFSNMILEGLYGEVPFLAREGLLQMREKGDDLLQLINNILDFSKVEAGQMQLHKEKFSARDAAEIAMGKLMAKAERKNIAVNLDIPADLPLGLGDKRKIEQILINLIENAIKFSKQGAINIRVWVDQNNLFFSVQDSGPGIEPERINGIFNVFEHNRMIFEEGDSGIGLGLPLCKSFINLHGGEMEVKSEPGRGSEFSFSLPLGQRSAGL